ncbi:MAG: TonB-dependent receptor [Treponema sp.]|nr:TonB-dependent receptor [Treponema sp.]
MVFSPLYAQKAESERGEREDSGQDVEAGWEPDDDYRDSGEDEGIVVTGTRDTASQVKVISKDEIDRIAAPDLPALLEEALDINVTRYGAYGNSSDINIRGFNTERIAILIDGVPVNSAMSGNFDFNSLDMNNIESIEVIYGGSDSKFNVSGALGGVVNIITVKDRKPGLHIAAGLSNISYIPGNYTEWDGTKKEPAWQDLVNTQQLNFSLSHGGNNFSWGAHFFGNRAGNNYLYKDSILGRIRRKQYNEVWDAGGGTLLAWNFPDLSKLILNIDTYLSDRTLPATGFSSVTGTQNDFTTRESLMYEIPAAFHDNLSAEFTLNHSWARMSYERIGMPLSRHNQNGVTAINRWGWYPTDAIVLRAGWDYRYIYFDSTATGIQNRHDGGVYLTAEVSPVRHVLVIPSVKAVTDGGTIVPVPKLGFVWEAADFLTLKNNYFRSFKFPDFEDLYWAGGGSIGNPDLKPEDGWGADIVAEFRYRESLAVETTFFAQMTKDSIHWHRSLGGIWEPQNIGEAAFFGSDTRTKVVVPVNIGPIKRISPSLSYQFLSTHLLSYGYTWEDKQRIPYQPMHTVGASLDIFWGTGSFLVSGHYESGRYTSRTNLVELDPYFLLTVNISQNIGEQFTVFAVIRNLLNQSYESHYGYPMPGLTVTLGVRMNIEGIGAGNKNGNN